MNTELFKYTLRLADNALILGHRMSEWCGHGPELEEDIAIINVALDHIGQCRSLYQYAAEIENKGRDEDDLAYLRNEREFYNIQLCELPNGHYGDTIARSFFYDAFMKHFYEALVESSDKQLSAIAEKSLKEVLYHYKHSAEWIIRFGDGTEESHNKIQQSIDDIWVYTGEMFEMDVIDNSLLEAGIGVDKSKIRTKWTADIDAVLSEATLQKPEGTVFQTGGRSGIHTEHMGYILAEMQYLKRQMPEATW